MQKTHAITPFRSPFPAVSHYEKEELPKVFKKSFAFYEKNCVFNMHSIKQAAVVRQISSITFLQFDEAE